MLPSKLGHFAQVLEADWVPPGPEVEATTRGEDLLPIDPKEVATYLLDKGGAIADGVNCMVNAVNYLALCAGHAPVPEKLKDQPWTRAHKVRVDHFCELLEHLEESDEKVSSYEGAIGPLSSARFGYDGEPVMVMEDIDAELSLRHGRQ